ncbi:hypothetical protein Tco_0869276 [Tanacetum coccineum]|uniref:Uncharacterized protein n=1 Tax=Tanacetum coccineum TaxID=301880 RepID=A0ABQ5B4W9_9ASTR
MTAFDIDIRLIRYSFVSESVFCVLEYLLGIPLPIFGLICATFSLDIFAFIFPDLFVSSHSRYPYHVINAPMVKTLFRGGVIGSTAFPFGAYGCILGTKREAGI